MNKGNFKDAIKCFEQILKIDPRNSTSLSYIGNCLHKSNNITEAINYYRKALSTDPTLTDTYQALGQALIELGHLNEAE